MLDLIEVSRTFYFFKKNSLKPRFTHHTHTYIGACLLSPGLFSEWHPELGRSKARIPKLPLGLPCGCLGTLYAAFPIIFAGNWIRNSAIGGLTDIILDFSIVGINIIWQTSAGIPSPRPFRRALNLSPLPYISKLLSYFLVCFIQTAKEAKQS